MIRIETENPRYLPRVSMRGTWFSPQVIRVRLELTTNGLKGHCYYSGEKMSFDQGSPDVMSIDRLDSSKGYTISNSTLCCWVYNNMKQQMNEDDFYQVIKTIYEHSIKMDKS